MVRRHGWELPAHAFQVVAITVFCLLVVAYYVFFAPFVGTKPFQDAAIALYSPLAVTVFFLYIRCTGINPADSGLGIISEERPPEEPEAKGLPSESPGSVIHRHNPSATANQGVRNHGILSVLAFVPCGWLVIPDCKSEPDPSATSLDEDVLFCVLCNAEVHKFSKHCRSCDKCVDGFDHHCRWLNNCVGKKNYASFVALMASSLVLLILQWGTGVAVFTRCFTNKRAEERIVDKLGNSFSRPPFAAVVAVCTLVSLLASIPLGELFFFHIILMRKGITTYEYVVAMRAQNEPAGAAVEGDAQSVPSSPGSSTATGLTGSSSLGLQYRGAWCTPPRVFVEHQDEVIPHLEPGRVPSTVDPDSMPKADKKTKKPVRISAWKLAKLDANEAARVAAKARETSSVLRQISGKGADADYSSSDVGSSRSSASTELGVMRGKRTEEGRFTASTLVMPSSKGDYNLNFDSGDNVTSSRSSMSSPGHILNDSDGLSPLPSRATYANPATLRLSTPRATQETTTPLGVRTSSYKPPHVSARAAPQRDHRLWVGKYSSSDGSSLDSLDDRTPGFLGRPPRDQGRNSVFSYIRQAFPSDVERPPPSGLTAVDRENPCLRRPNDLLYPENSIFYGGPLRIPGTTTGVAAQPSTYTPSSSQTRQPQPQPQQQPQGQQPPLPTSRLNPAIARGPESSVFSTSSDLRQQQPRLVLPAAVRSSIERLHSPIFHPRSGGY